MPDSPAHDPRLYRDPRPDLAEDAELWHRLLWRSYRQAPRELHGALMGFRCEGARLERTADTLVLRPGHCPDYPALRARYLAPHSADLIRLLAEAA